MERELLLLGLLRQEEMHGYQLYDFIEETMAMCVDLKKPTAYYLLGKLADSGLVAESEEQVGNRPPRRVYRLTPAGEARYQELLRQSLAEYAPVRFGNMVGLAFLDDLETSEALGLLGARRHALEQMLTVASAIPAHQGSSQYVVEHQIAFLRAELRWLDSLIERLGAADAHNKSTQ